MFMCALEDLLGVKHLLDPAIIVMQHDKKTDVAGME